MCTDILLVHIKLIKSDKDFYFFKDQTHLKEKQEIKYGDFQWSFYNLTFKLLAFKMSRQVKTGSKLHKWLEISKGVLKNYKNKLW